ncbi:hypothetical protein EON77_12250, partial [bacterium]
MTLTPEGLSLVQDTLLERWQSGASSGKWTRETRAGLLGLSVATSEKILSGGAADRGTLALAFKNLGIDWDE